MVGLRCCHTTLSLRSPESQPTTRPIKSFTKSSNIPPRSNRQAVSVDFALSVNGVGKYGKTKERDYSKEWRLMNGNSWSKTVIFLDASAAKIISYYPPGKVEGKKLIREDVSGAAKGQSAAEIRWKFAIWSEREDLEPADFVFNGSYIKFYFLMTLKYS